MFKFDLIRESNILKPILFVKRNNVVDAIRRNRGNKKIYVKK